MIRSNVKEEYLARCVPIIREAVERREKRSITTPEAISSETARNYVYEARKRLGLTDKLVISCDRTHVYVRPTNDFFDEAYPGDYAAKVKEERAVVAVTERKRPGVAVITVPPTVEIIKLCAGLLDCMALEAVEFLGTYESEVEALVQSAQLNCIVSKCQGGTLLT